jgi:hypothetical protein
MKLRTLFFLASATSPLMAQPASATANGPAPQPTFAMPSGPIAPGEAVAPPPAPATDNSVFPSANFAPSRYESLWTKSPFAVETAEVSAEESPDYFLVGIANVDGISYASLIERQNQEHFLISSDKPTRGMTLSNITRSHDGTDTYANVLKDGQAITLKLQQAPASAPTPGMPPGMQVMNGVPPNMQGPGTITPNIPIPGSNPMQGPGAMRPFPRIHRPTIHLPNQNQPPPPPQPVPAH